MMRLRDPRLKAIARAGYRLLLTAATAANTLAPPKKELRLFYGGARVGNIGGALVKVGRLQTRFPQARWGYGAVYSLSNAPYLSARALQMIKRRGIPILHNQNGVFYPAWYAGDWRAQNARMASAYHAADFVFWQSKFCRMSADHFLGQREGPGEILYNAVDTMRFTPRCPDRAEAPFRILLAGKLDTHIGYRVMSSIDAVARARRDGLDCVLDVAGWTAPALQAQAIEHAARNAVPLRFLGSYSQTDAPDVYRAADAFIMMKYLDPCPNTVIEAMACGLPIIYADSGGVAELVGDAGVGIPTPLDWERIQTPDAGSVADAIGTVAASRHDLSAKGRKRAVEQFDLLPWLDRHAAVIANLQGRPNT